MASSKVMPSSTSRNSDLRRRSSTSSTKSSISELYNINHHSNNQHRQQSNNSDNNPGSMTVDGLLRNVYGDNQASDSTLLDAEITLLDAAGAVTAISDNEASGTPTIRRQESASSAGGKTVDEVWREIVAGRSDRREGKQEVPDDEMMTLEDFLAKAGAVEEQDVKVEPLMLPSERLSGGLFSFDSIPASPFPTHSVDGVIGFGNGVEVIGGRGRKRALLEPLDKAAQQRQRRMIKNRESAARSRERKQAYLVELESLAVKLEEENERLLKEKRTKERYKQLMETVVPVVEQRRPPRVLRRVRSMDW
ncbi:G-box-binding factor 4 isoform X2 [Cornus florida]|uniref:G-box-binding factor 4 isoform X2 n=1 Tax=Cornus florida TaxID=4283 RepID=UPI002898C9AF|nr:G-box-binding factor 4 isoform X2 [Cornus florida]